MVRTRATSSATITDDNRVIDATNPVAPPPSQQSAGHRDSPPLPASRSNASKQTPQASQVSANNSETSTPQLTTDQCQQLISMLAQQLPPAASTSSDTPAVTNFS
uniref:Uncharacterized protein n=1 Tax=Cannabis sativa TaxID=3483 RepID=A0A803PTD5_CANSA